MFRLTGQESHCQTVLELEKAETKFTSECEAGWRAHEGVQVALMCVVLLRYKSSIVLPAKGQMAALKWNLDAASTY